MKAMILAAGQGSRLRPLTDKIPKALLPLNDTTPLKFVVERLKQAGVTSLIINTFHLASQVETYLADNSWFGVRGEVSRESVLLETGGGLKKASWFFDEEPFILHNVDILSDLDLKEMYRFHMEGGQPVTVAVRSRKTSRYFLFDEKNLLAGWKSTKDDQTILTGTTNSTLRSLSFMGI